MIKKALILPDVHLDYKVPEPYKAVKRFIKKQEKPFDLTILLGDFLTVGSLSHWDQNKRRVIEGKRYRKEMALANKELDFLQDYSGKIVYLEGNHENWVKQYIDKHPEMEGMIEIPNALDLRGRGIEWVEMNKLFKVGHAYFTHGMWTNKYSAAKHLNELGCNIIYGHTHRSQVFASTAKMQEPMKAWNLGCLCDQAPTYMKGKPSNWSVGFGIMYWDDKTDKFNVYPIEIIDNEFIWEGKKYR